VHKYEEFPDAGPSQRFALQRGNPYEGGRAGDGN
jgi:hypothetical protein